MELKTCSNCQQEKPLDKFALRKDSATGRRHACIKCRSEQRNKSLRHEERLRIDSGCAKSAHAVWDKATNKRGLT